MRIIAEESGLEIADLEPSSEFAAYGIDSLLSLTICGRIQEEMKLELSSTLFADYPTVNDLTNFLAGSGSGATSLPPSSGSELAGSGSGATSLPPSPGSELAGRGSGAISLPPSPGESVSTPGTTFSSDSYETTLSSVTGDDDILASIHAAIAEETGVAPEDLKPSTSFSQLGIDSLLKLTIMGKLREDLRLDLPSTLLDENDTLREVEKALGLPPKEPPSGEKSPTNVARQSIEVGADSPPYATSILLQGNRSAAKKTFFLFPEASGSGVSYQNIPKISPDVVVYVLNCPWQKNPQDMNCSFEFACTKYVHEVLRRQPQGPYYLGGWSAGGIVAYETAQQLTRRGLEVARLVLLDSPNPIGLENPRLYDFLKSMRMLGTSGNVPPTWLRPHFDAFLVMLEGYKVKPFAGGSQQLQTHIVYARDGLAKYPSDPRPPTRPDDPRDMLWILNNRTDFSASGWCSLVGAENLTVQVVDDVNHFTLMAPGSKIQGLRDFIQRAMG